jgi:hypothetical protein
MAYLGQVDRKASNVQVFNVTSSTSATHSIGWTPPSEQTLIVTINGVKQHTNAFSFSGSTLTLGAALVATDELEVVGINDIGNSLTPVDNSVTTSKLGDNSVTLAKMAGGTDGNLITYDASGDPAYVATGAATNVLTSNGAGAAPTFQAAAAGGLTHFSQFRLSTNFSNDQDPITSNLVEVATPVGFGKLPNVAAGASGSMAVSSGIFTFPTTGLWLVQGNFFLIQPSNGAGGNVCNLSTTINNSAGPTWAVASQFTMGDYYGDKFEGSTSYIFDVTDTAECKVRFGVNVTLTDTVTQGTANENLTYFTFMKLADT